MTFFQLKNFIHSDTKYLKFQIELAIDGNHEVVFHVVGRPYDVPSDFVIAVLSALPI
jgi:hypothetical protein